MFTENRLKLSENDAVDALFGLVNASGWKVRGWFSPSFAFFSGGSVVLVPEEEHVSHGSPRPWGKWQKRLDETLEIVDSRSKVICSGRAPLAAWTYLGNKLSAQEVSILHFPIRDDRSPQIFQVKGKFSSENGSKRPYQLLSKVHIAGHPTPKAARNVFIFASLNSSFAVSSSNLPAAYVGEVVHLSPQTFNQGAWMINSENIPELLPQLNQELDKRSGASNLMLASSGPDALAFVFGLVVNLQKFKSVQIADYVSGRYEVGFTLRS
jgi:hypothetical protein